MKTKKLITKLTVAVLLSSSLALPATELFNNNNAEQTIVSKQVLASSRRKHHSGHKKHYNKRSRKRSGKRTRKRRNKNSLKVINRHGHKTYINTQILSRKAVRSIYHSINRTNRYTDIAIALTRYLPKYWKALAIPLILSKHGNSGFRRAIRKAYRRHKRVKIVMISGSTMTEDRAYYHVIK